MDRQPGEGIEMQLPANAENVSLVRHAIAGAAESLGMSEVATADLKTVVTEACMNVAQHAYDEPGGPMEVLAWPDGGEIVVVVADSGGGMRPRADTRDGSLRLGLSLIASMTSEFEITGRAGNGTRVTMKLPIDGAVGVDGEANSNGAAERLGAAGSSGVSLSARDSVALAPILSRVIGVLAARRDFTVDELSDAVLFGDAITGDVSRIDPEGPVRFRLEEIGDSVELRVGPLRDGDGERLREGLSLPGELGGSLESLAASVFVDIEGGAEGGMETLCVCFGRRERSG